MENDSFLAWLHCPNCDEFLLVNKDYGSIVCDDCKTHIQYETNDNDNEAIITNFHI